jgi:hypothetical protein
VAGVQLTRSWDDEENEELPTVWGLTFDVVTAVGAAGTGVGGGAEAGVSVPPPPHAASADTPKIHIASEVAGSRLNRRKKWPTFDKSCCCMASSPLVRN